MADVGSGLNVNWIRTKSGLKEDKNRTETGLRLDKILVQTWIRTGIKLEYARLKL